VQFADLEIKKNCLEELGQGWLMQVISHDASNSLKMSPLVVGNGAVHQDERHATNGSHTGCEPSSIGNSHDSNSVDSETQDAHEGHIADDEIAVSEQGLDLIRNLIGGQDQSLGSETVDMIDYLFSTLGQNQIFGMLSRKLSTTQIQRDGTAKNTHVPLQAEIVAAVVWILVHIAASVPRHRQQVVAQTELLTKLVPQFSNPNREVRLSLCWLVNNLTWLNDTSDKIPCMQRAQELERLGYLGMLENLQHDPDLDIRERAKTAVFQMRQNR
jgi:hypothetical protein